MNNKIGVMQGRLVPKYQGRYQAFPVGMWKDEFKIAKECGIDLVEFILDFNDAEEISYAEFVESTARNQKGDTGNH